MGKYLGYLPVATTLLLTALYLKQGNDLTHALKEKTDQAAINEAALKKSIENLIDENRELKDSLLALEKAQKEKAQTAVPERRPSKVKKKVIEKAKSSKKIISQKSEPRTLKVVKQKIVKQKKAPKVIQITFDETSKD